MMATAFFGKMQRLDGRQGLIHCLQRGIDFAVAMSYADKASFIGTRGYVDSLIEHRSEELSECSGVSCHDTI